MFKILGGLVILYTLYAASKGEVYAKSGAWGKTILKTETPQYFWTVIFIYSGLGIALLTVF